MREHACECGQAYITTWGVQVLRYPNFFSREWKQIETWKLLEETRLFFSFGEAKWQHCTTRSMLVTRSSCNSVFDTEMATFTFEEQRVIIRFLPLAWHETNRNSSTVEWDMQWWRYGREKCAFMGATVQRRPKVVWKQPEGASATLRTNP